MYVCPVFHSALCTVLRRGKTFQFPVFLEKTDTLNFKCFSRVIEPFQYYCLKKNLLHLSTQKLTLVSNLFKLHFPIYFNMKIYHISKSSHLSTAAFCFIFLTKKIGRPSYDGICLMEILLEVLI